MIRYIPEYILDHYQQKELQSSITGFALLFDLADFTPISTAGDYRCRGRTNPTPIPRRCRSYRILRWHWDLCRPPDEWNLMSFRCTMPRHRCLPSRYRENPGRLWQSGPRIPIQPQWANDSRRRSSCRLPRPSLLRDWFPSQLACCFLMFLVWRGKTLQRMKRSWIASIALWLIRITVGFLSWIGGWIAASS